MIAAIQAAHALSLLEPRESALAIARRLYDQGALYSSGGAPGDCTPAFALKTAPTAASGDKRTIC